MRIGIDTRLKQETGVGRYIRNLLHWLKRIDKKNEYIEINPPIPWHSISEQIHLPRIISRYRVDLMHFPYFNVPLLYNKPFIVTIHDLIIDKYPTGRASTYPAPVYWIKRFGYHTVLRHAVSGARAIIVPSNATRHELVRLHPEVLPEKITVIYEGADQIDERTKERKNERTMIQFKSLLHTPYFLYVGNAYPHKNLERLVEAYSQLRIIWRSKIPLRGTNDELQEMKLIFVGKDDYFYRQLQQRVSTSPVADSIMFAGQVSDEELSWLYQHAVATVVPSLAEGFGLPAIEAMQNGGIIAISDVAAHREICGDAPVYFDPMKTDDIIRKMRAIIIMDGSERKRRIQQGLAQAKKYSWKKMAEQTVRIYEKCCMKTKS